MGTRQLIDTVIKVEMYAQWLVHTATSNLMFWLNVNIIENLQTPDTQTKLVTDLCSIIDIGVKMLRTEQFNNPGI